MKRPVLFFVVVILFLIGISAQANAAPVTGTFSGTIDQASFPDLSEVGIGTRIEGTFIYDSNAPWLLHNGPNTDIYYPSIYDKITFTIFGATDTYHIESGLAGMSVTNSDSGDGLFFPCIQGLSGSIASYTPDEASLDLAFTDDAFSDTSIPTSLDFDDFTGGSIWISNYGDPFNGFSLHAQIDRLSAQSVPEPSSVLLLASGFIGAVVSARRFKK